MNSYAAATMLMIGLAAGFLAAWLLRGRDVARSEAARTLAAQRADSLLAQLQDATVARATAETRAETEQRAHAEKLGELTSLRSDIEARMKALAAEALHGSQESFLKLADAVFEKHKQAADTLFSDREKAIEGLLGPINASLQEYRKGLSEIEKAREAAYGALSMQMQEVARAQGEASRETRRLVTALRSPQTRGRWGEEQLKNVIEMAGMTRHVDYLPQQTIDGDEGRLRPDLVIRVPGDRRIVVDVKTPLLAYLDAVEASDDAVREDHLRRHARQLRTHMRQLSEKRYWEALLPLTPDFVVMFVPGENFYAAAAERDPKLFEDAVAARVLIVTPTTMVALAKTIASGWNQAKLAEDAQKIAELGRDLYKRLAAMGTHIVHLGAALRRSVEHYNSFVGSVEGSVMPQARRFNELAIEGAREALPELRPLEVDTRQVRADRDLTIARPEVIPLAAAEHPPAAE